MQQGVYRLFTYAFLHGGLYHIMMNMVSFSNMGMSIEPSIGAKKYCLLLFVTLITSGLPVTSGNYNSRIKRRDFRCFWLLREHVSYLWKHPERIYSVQHTSNSAAKRHHQSYAWCILAGSSRRFHRRVCVWFANALTKRKISFAEMKQIMYNFHIEVLKGVFIIWMRLLHTYNRYSLTHYAAS